MSGSQTIVLEPLAGSDARDFLADSFEALVQDLADANDVPPDTARERAREIERSLLPDHEMTRGHSFMAIVADGQRVGRLWLGPMPDDRPLLYIWDILIDGHRRGEGLGTEAIAEVLRFARRSGAAGVGLTVWDTNSGARRLYERLGFMVDTDGDGASLMVRFLD